MVEEHLLLLVIELHSDNFVRLEEEYSRVCDIKAKMMTLRDRLSCDVEGLPILLL